MRGPSKLFGLIKGCSTLLEAANHENDRQLLKKGGASMAIMSCFLLKKSFRPYKYFVDSYI